MVEPCPATREAVLEQDPSGIDGCPICGRAASQHWRERAVIEEEVVGQLVLARGALLDSGKFWRREQGDPGSEGFFEIRRVGASEDDLAIRIKDGPAEMHVVLSHAGEDVLRWLEESRP